jgi:biopolymer transport protein ExbD
LYDLSERKEEADDWLADQTVIAIPNNNEVYFGREKVRKEDVPERVRQTRENLGRDRLIHVRAYETVSYGAAVETVAAVQAAGHQRIGLSAEHPHWHMDAAGPDYTSARLYPFEAGVLADDVAVSQLDSDSHAPSRSRPDQQFAHPRIIVQAQSTGDSISVSLNSQPVSLRDLPHAVRRALNPAPEAELWFTASPRLPVEEIMPVLNAMRSGGASTVTLSVSP